MKAKLPIFVISGKSPLSDSGGYPAYANSLSVMLSSLGYKIYTLAIADKETVEKVEYGEIHFLSTKLLKFFPFLHHLALAGLPYYSIIFAKEIIKIAKEKDIDKIILWGMGPWAFAGIFLKLLGPKDKKIILVTSYFTSTRHEMKGALDSIRIKDYGVIPKIRYFLVYEVVARIFHIFEKLTLDSCDLVIVHYNSSQNIIKKYFNVDNKKIHMFPWYTEIFKRQGKKIFKQKMYQHPLIVSICRQDPRKGLNFLIRAIKIVAKEIPNVRCLIVGTGSFFELNKRLSKKLHLSKHIYFPGFVSDIKPILKEADIAVIIPLRQGSSALTVLEAMSYGKAVVVSNCDGIPEDITHNVSGLIVEKGNEEALAQALITLIKNPLLRKRLGQNAYNAYKKRFDFKKTASEIDQLLQQYH